LFTIAGHVSKTVHNSISIRKLVKNILKDNFCDVGLFVLILVIFNICISQGSVATQLKCGNQDI